MFGGNAKLKALENELRLTKLKLGEVEEERDDLKNLTLELQKVLSKMTKDVKVRENENDEKVRYVFFFNFFQQKIFFCISLHQSHKHHTYPERRVTSSKNGDGTRSSSGRGERKTSDGGVWRGRGGVE